MFKRNMIFKKCKLICMMITIIIILSACTLPGIGKSVSDNGIIIAGGNTTERQILAEIVSQMCDHYLSDSDITLINNLGSTLLILQAMNGEEANISGTMYTGTSLTGELNMSATTDPIAAMESVVKGYSDKYNMVWFPSYGFENTYAFMVTRQFAEDNNITKISDLASYRQNIQVGVDNSWIERKGDGYEGFRQLYGFEFTNIKSMEIGLVYDALKSGEMDVALGYSTDGRINGYDLILLKDDLHLFPPYDASPVVTKELLRKFPEIETVLLKLEGTIDSSMMQKLNRKSDEELVEPRIVAKEFLEENDFFENTEVIPLSARNFYKNIIRDILPLKEEAK